MAMTVTFPQLDQKYDFWGNTPVAYCQLTLDNSYPAGGYVAPAGLTGLFRGGTILGMEIIGVNTAAIAWSYYWNTQTSKLMVLGTAGGTAGTADLVDATAAQNFSTFVLSAVVIGLR